MIYIFQNRKKQFFVRATASNAEPLSVTETFTQKKNAWKNIKAQCKAFNSDGLVVKDTTNKTLYWYAKNEIGIWKKQIITDGLKDKDGNYIKGTKPDKKITVNF